MVACYKKPNVEKDWKSAKPEDFYADCKNIGKI